MSSDITKWSRQNQINKWRWVGWEELEDLRGDDRIDFLLAKAKLHADVQISMKTRIQAIEKELGLKPNYTDGVL